MASTKQKKLFEAWAKEEGLNIDHCSLSGYDYKAYETESAWRAWQASRKPSVAINWIKCHECGGTALEIDKELMPRPASKMVGASFINSGVHFSGKCWHCETDFVITFDLSNIYFIAKGRKNG